MLSVEQIRKTNPEFEKFTDEELLKLREVLYSFIESALDEYVKSSRINKTL